MNHNRGIFFVVLILTVLIISPVSAHEGREVGDYTIEIGWREEPAYTGLMNGPEITVSHHDDEGEALATPETENVHTNSDEALHEAEINGIEGLEDTLQIEVSFGPEARVLNLRPIPDEPGHYTADLIPTLPGDYSFRVFGVVEETEVDETFSAADGQFSTVEPIEDIQFP
jgi:hypothetical protein